MARKRDMIQIQTEVSTQEEWEQEISRPGLTVVDVYPDWCGPCTAMVGTLKKIKFELGDDLLSYVTARADDIPALEAFRGRCEPLWVFFGSGQPVYQLRGAHSPLLARKIVEELEKEKKAMAGEIERSPISLVCDAPAEVELPPSTSVPAEDETETAEALNARRQRSELRVRHALAPYGLLLVGSAALDRRDEILSLLESQGFVVAMETVKTLTEGEGDELVTPPPPPPVEEETATEPQPAAGPPDDPGTTEEGLEGGTGSQPAPAEPETKVEGEGESAEQAGRVKEDPETAARRQAVKEKLLEGECTLLVMKDSEFSEERPYRWLTAYLGRAPAPPPGVGSQTEVPPPATGGQHGADAPTTDEEPPSDAPPDPGEPEPVPEPITQQLQDLLGEDSALAVFSPDTVVGQWAGLRHHFPDLHRAPAPAGRRVAFVVFPGDRERAAEQLTEAGFTVLHSGVDQLTEEVAGQLVARLEGGDSQLPELTAAPVLAAAVASDGGAALAAIANLDPLYLSDSPDQADRDARLVFASWGVDIPSLQTATVGGIDGAAGGTEGATVGADGAAGETENGAEGTATGEVPTEGTAASEGITPPSNEAAGEEPRTTTETAAEE